MSDSDRESVMSVHGGGGKTVVRFHSGVGSAQAGAEMGPDSRYHRLQTSPLIPERPGGPELCVKTLKLCSEVSFQLFRGLFDT